MKKIKSARQAWWHIPEIPASGKFVVIVVYTVNSRSAWTTQQDSASKRKKGKEGRRERGSQGEWKGKNRDIYKDKIWSKNKIPDVQFSLLLL